MGFQHNGVEFSTLFEPISGWTTTNPSTYSNFVEAGTALPSKYFFARDVNGVTKSSGIYSAASITPNLTAPGGLSESMVRKGYIFAGGNNTTAYNMINTSPNVVCNAIGTITVTPIKKYFAIFMIGGGQNGSNGSPSKNGLYGGSNGGGGGVSGERITKMIALSSASGSMTIVVGGIGQVSSISYVDAANGATTISTTQYTAPGFTGGQALSIPDYSSSSISAIIDVGGYRGPATFTPSTYLGISGGVLYGYNKNITSIPGTTFRAGTVYTSIGSAINTATTAGYYNWRGFGGGGDPGGAGLTPNGGGSGGKQGYLNATTFSTVNATNGSNGNGYGASGGGGGGGACSQATTLGGFGLGGSGVQGCVLIYY